MKRVLIKSETPVFAFAAKPDEDGNSRCNRIVLVTDELFKGNYIVVIEEVNSAGWQFRRTIKANKIITSYENSTLMHEISQAYASGRMLYADIKRSRNTLNVRRGAIPQASMRESDFKANIQNFWANVKWEKGGKKHTLAVSQRPVTPRG